MGVMQGLQGSSSLVGGVCARVVSLIPLLDRVATARGQRGGGRKAGLHGWSLPEIRDPLAP